MIVLDTHVWVWCVQEPQNLTIPQLAAIVGHEDEVIGVSAISCWEVAKLVEYGRLPLITDLSEWFEIALGYPGVTLLPLTPEVALDGSSLPGNFHRDPWDQIIVGTARVNGCQLVSADRQIINYPHVQTI